MQLHIAQGKHAVRIGHGPFLLRGVALFKAQQEGANRELRVLRGAVGDGVAHGHSVLLEGHGDLAGHADAPHVVGPLGSVLHHQGGQPLPAVFHRGVVGKFLGGEIFAGIAAAQLLLEAGQQRHPVIGRGAGGH